MRSTDNSDRAYQDIRQPSFNTILGSGNTPILTKHRGTNDENRLYNIFSIYTKVLYETLSNVGVKSL